MKMGSDWPVMAITRLIDTIFPRREHSLRNILAVPVFMSCTHLTDVGFDQIGLASHIHKQLVGHAALGCCAFFSMFGLRQRGNREK
jgi:hypothetical protein